jgi:hypothetical protein
VLILLACPKTKMPSAVTEEILDTAEPIVTEPEMAPLQKMPDAIPVVEDAVVFEGSVEFGPSLQLVPRERPSWTPLPLEKGVDSTNVVIRDIPEVQYPCVVPAVHGPRSSSMAVSHLTSEILGNWPSTGGTCRLWLVEVSSIHIKACSNEPDGCVEIEKAGQSLSVRIFPGCGFDFQNFMAGQGYSLNEEGSLAFMRDILITCPELTK